MRHSVITLLFQVTYTLLLDNPHQGKCRLIPWIISNRHDLDKRWCRGRFRIRKGLSIRNTMWKKLLVNITSFLFPLLFLGLIMISNMHGMFNISSKKVISEYFGRSKRVLEECKQKSYDFDSQCQKMTCAACLNFNKSQCDRSSNRTNKRFPKILTRET